MSLGTVFISHKHKDKEIAKVVGDFMRDASGNRIDIYLSSDPRYRGTRIGANLSTELDQAIRESGVVVLVYTGKSAKVDWEYCIYECAFARSQDIRVIVMQCVEDAPAPFLSSVRTLVSDRSNVYKFTKDFLTSPNFLKDQNESVTAFAPEDPVIEAKAGDFHKKLNDAIASHLGRDPEQWSAWPTMRVRLSGASISKIKSANANDREAMVREELLCQATVTSCAGADQIFGVGIESGQPFGSLVASWQESFENEQPEWLDSICTQIDSFARKRFPQLRECRLTEVQGKSSVVPVVTNMLTFPPAGDKEFDLKFYDIQSRSPGLRDIMIDRENVHCEIVEPDGSSGVDLRQVYRKMKERGVFRLPILDGEWHVRYMIHRSVISEFLYDTKMEDATLQDVLSESDQKEVFNSTYVFLGEDSTVEDAREALAAIPGARDVFITRTGEPEMPILGMVTNTDLDRYV